MFLDVNTLHAFGGKYNNPLTKETIMFDLAIPLMHLALVGLPAAALALDNFYGK